MLNIAECKSSLSDEISADISDGDLLRIQDRMQSIAEVLVDHALHANLNNKD